MTVSLDEILEIPGNRPVFEALADSLRERQSVAFVGAGASAPLYPLWGELLEQLADFAVEKAKAESKDAARWKADTSSGPQQRVNVIVRKLGDNYYRDFLKATFSARLGSDGKRYTPVQAALLRLPFRGYVTTNYDPALDYARAELRPGCVSASRPTWRDDDEVHAWLTGDVFKPLDACPILWLHGSWERPQDIVLNAGEYAQAYKPGLYRRTFERLVLQDTLVFAGFGFNDPQLFFLLGELWRDLQDARSGARHFGLLSLPLTPSAPIDHDEIAERKEALEADFHVKPLFYPVIGGDHSALSTVLAALEEPATTPTSPVLVSVPVGAPEPILTKWVHEPSNDEKFTGRLDEIARLDRWVRDPAVRAVGVVAVGGTGKTALVGHWLKETVGWQSRRFEGLFSWSFYQDRATTNFLAGLLQWAHGAFGNPAPVAGTDLRKEALRLVQNRSIVVVLDGLEVLQEIDTSRHGSFLDGALREFLVAYCQREHSSLAVLTSRVVFADLERFVGTAFHPLELFGLPDDQGAELLKGLDVHGAARERKEISERLEGHPLALRVFAEALPEADRDEPRRFLDLAFRIDELTVSSPMADKLRRLLSFYAKCLSPTAVRLLSVVALFRSPVADETVLRLTQELFSREHKLPSLDEDALDRELQRLRQRQVLTRERLPGGGHGSSCHPVLRDHFRSVLQGTGKGRQAAEMLAGAPATDKSTTVAEIELVLLAIDLLLAAGDVKAADELYYGRLENGRVFLRLLANSEGLECALSFVEKPARQDKRFRSRLSRERLAFHLNAVGVFASHAGQPELALRFYEVARGLYRELRDLTNLSVVLQNESELHVLLGNFAEATSRATEALELGPHALPENEVRDGYTTRAWAFALGGRLPLAMKDFARANELDRDSPAETELHGLLGVRWAELLLANGSSDRATRLLASNIEVCRQRDWNEDVARSTWLLAVCALAEGRLTDAERDLHEAEEVFRRGHLLFDIARLCLTAGLLAVAKKEQAEALSRAEEALSLATPRGFRLVQADALVLRGRARIVSGCIGDWLHAQDDAEEALRIARDGGYPWAERDALFLRADLAYSFAKAATEPVKAERFRREAQVARDEAAALAAKLVFTEEDFARAAREAKVWLAEWKRERAEAPAKTAK